LDARRFYFVCSLKIFFVIATSRKATRRNLLFAEQLLWCCPETADFSRKNRASA